MYRRSFVSVSVSNHKLKIVKTSKEGKHVVKAATYEIPDGIVSQGKVEKPGEFAGLLKMIWKKERLKEKAIGLILPEFSTFMKTLVLPRVSLSELDEAVRWQSREFLPHEGSEMVLDWKIIGEKSDSYEVLLVAIEVGDLSGFVGAVDAAGLLPVFVETTSLCLERIAEGNAEGKLVVYRSKGTIVATVISGKKVLATSVINNADDQLVVANLAQILARFNKNDIAKVAVCGNGLTKEFLNAIQVKLNLPIEGLKLSVTGLSESDIQHYIIAISQQSINPEEPSNAYSINLLPPAWVVHYKNQMRDFRLWTLTLVWSVVVFMCFLAALGTYTLLSQEALALQSKKNTPKEVVSGQPSLTAVSSEITKVNAATNKLDAVIKAISYPQVPVNSIEQKRIPTTTILAYDVNIETGKVSISGIAESRADLLKLKQVLEDAPEFSKVTVPLSSLLTEASIPFSMQMDYKK